MQAQNEHFVFFFADIGSPRRLRHSIAGRGQHTEYRKKLLKFPRGRFYAGQKDAVLIS